MQTLPKPLPTEESYLQQTIEYYDQQAKKYMDIYNSETINVLEIKVSGIVNDSEYSHTLFPETDIYLKDYANNMGAYFSALKMIAQDSLRKLGQENNLKVKGDAKTPV